MCLEKSLFGGCTPILTTAVGRIGQKHEVHVAGTCQLNGHRYRTGTTYRCLPCKQERCGHVCKDITPRCRSVHSSAMVMFKDSQHKLMSQALLQRALSNHSSTNTVMGPSSRVICKEMNLPCTVSTVLIPRNEVHAL